MRSVLFLLVAFVVVATSAIAEETSPSYSTKIERRVDVIDIDGMTYYDVTIKFKSNTPDAFVTPKVRVKVIDSKGNVVWKKRFRNCYLYIFHRGQIQVGTKNYARILCDKYSDTGRPYCKIRENEGVY